MPARYFMRTVLALDVFNHPVQGPVPEFTYKGYSVDRVIHLADKEAFFSLPEVQEMSPGHQQQCFSAGGLW